MTGLLGWFLGQAEKFINWICRPANIGLRVMAAGAGLFAVSMAGNWVTNFSASQSPWGNLSFQLSNPSGASEFISTLGAVFGLIAFFVGAALAIHNNRTNCLSATKRVIALELRGLADTSDAPLKDAVPGRLVGAPESVLVDVRHHMQAAGCAALDRVLEELNAIPRDVKARCKDFARSDISTVVGGILQVPFLFHVGMLLDDEAQITLMDWERTGKAWRELSEADDGVRFRVIGLEEAAQDRSRQVVVAVSASYAVDEEGIARTFAGLPVVHLSLPVPVPNSLWSEAKQQALCHQFLQTIAQLAGGGAELIHLVVAAPASLVIRLGAAYDVRNFPSAVIYQYERTHGNKYPWGVRLKTHGVVKAEVVETGREVTTA
ncbi:SAVED domain-containing protein [Cupriavidus sp. HPC(L)]|uniref:SAVED domain-containing protein n=1 Tax=Cupriavidus sp. HPC(L) TaxID=1217418 RepID=UPI00155DA592|nr:SAVED domain-containing protein [Cupriavidus sp. HPC(L)]